MWKKCELHDGTGRLVVNVYLLIKYTTIGLRIPGYGAAEVYSPEELRHAETNPTCKIQRKLLLVTQIFETKIDLPK